MTNMPLYLHFIFSFIATVGFAIFLNSPKSTLFASGLVGALGWTLYYYFINWTSNDVLSNFLATLVVSLGSEIFARKLKQPAIIFVIPGIIPLVPGLGMYNTMLYLIQQDYDNGISKGFNVLFVAGAISLGVLVVSSLFKSFNIVQSKKATKQ